MIRDDDHEDVDSDSDYDRGHTDKTLDNRLGMVDV
jgi:hypothetical protein